MRGIEYGEHRLYTSSDMLEVFRPDNPWLERRKELLVQSFTRRRRMFRELLGVWSLATGLKGYAILDAHGDHVDGQWAYFEGGLMLGTIQSWIDSLDGNVAALMILTCNPQDSEVSSRSSLVFHTNKSESLPGISLHPEVMRLYIPGAGYIERNYKKLRRIINGLKDDLKKYELPTSTVE